MKIFLGGDHAGFEYKEALVDFLKTEGLDAIDFGPYSIDSVDYPDFVHPLATGIQKNEAPFGVLICGSANGVAITANKHQGVRAALCWNRDVAELARTHNDANIICIPARFISLEMAKDMVKTFINTKFEGGRHANRVDKIDIKN